MKLFCESTLVHEENSGKESVIIQLLINDLYDQMNIIFPCLAYRKMALGFFPQTACYVEEKREENST